MNETNAHIRKLAAAYGAMKAEHASLKEAIAQLQDEIESRPRSITEEIDSIPGRRIFYNLSGRQNFDASFDRRRGNPINFLVSQDGPFVMTHYPLVMFLPNSPDTATNLGRWSPVSSWPLPTQQFPDQDIIDLSYELTDGGSQRNFQNEESNPMFSRPDNALPLPVPTIFAPNSTIQFFATFERIVFNANAAVPADGGELSVTLPGYRIANL